MPVRRSRRAARPVAKAWVTAAVSAAVPLCAPQAQTIEQLRGMSIEQLGELQVTSVSRSPQALNDSPASIYVITHDEIMRSGATALPEILRMAPNLEVARLNATDYAITARGFNVGDNASLSNKLLVLVDGRSVYSPMFGGVYWDMQVVPPETIERIEVISGPGAALWGANAVNGVINIITRPSSETQGGYLTLGAGNIDRLAGVEYGGRLAPDLTYRVQGNFTNSSAFSYASGKTANDGWWRPYGGVRLDWTPPNDSVSLEGNYLAAKEQPDGFIRGSDAAASWQHRFADGSSLQLLSYFENENRAVNSGSSFSVNTYDIEAQHNFSIGSWNSIVWGAGERAFRYELENTALALAPPNQTLNLANIFGQDTLALTSNLKLTLGVKLEDEPYAGWQVMPSARVAWKPVNRLLLWGAISRAVRSPTPVDANLQEFAGSLDVLNGTKAFRPETLTAYELGARAELSAKASVSVSVYYDDYDHLRSIDPGSAAAGSVYVFGNLMSGTTYGIEAWGNYQLASWWRMSAGINLLHEDLRFEPGSLTVAGLAFVADDPGYQGSLHSAIDLSDRVTWDTFFRAVGPLPHPGVPGYAEVNTTVAWNVTRSLQLSLSGFNLLHARHEEFIEGGVTTEIPRSFLAQARVRF